MSLPQYMQDVLDADRAEGVTVVVEDNTVQASAALHLYRFKDDIMDMIANAMPSGAACFPDGTLARLVGAIHPHISGNFGMDIMAPPTAQDVTEDYANYAVGAMGVIVVNCEDGTANCYAGTLTSTYPDPVELPPAPPLM